MSLFHNISGSRSTDDCPKTQQVSKTSAAVGIGSVIFGAAFMVSTAATALVTDDSLYTGGKARVNLSSKLDALVETIVGANCRLSQAEGSEAIRQELTTAASEFSSIVNGLRDGDTVLGIPTAEKTGRVIRSIDAVDALWAPMDAAVKNIAAGSGTGADSATVNESFQPLLKATLNLSTEVSGKYADPSELLQADAVTLSLAGRQRTFLKRMERSMCGASTGEAALSSPEDLGQTVSFFEQSLIALRDGHAQVGISPPPNDALKDALGAAHAKWSLNKAVFESAIDGQTVAKDEVMQTTAVTQELFTDINNVITLYLISSPGKAGVYKVPLKAYAETELAAWLADPVLIDAIKAQNVVHTDLSEEEIIDLDNVWRAEAKSGDGPLIQKLLGTPASEALRQRQLDTAGFVTEVFAMDNKGLNVAQSVATSDYWQGDEAKWQETYGAEEGTLHISDVEFDDSTGFYQAQASLVIVDPGTGEKIGAITFGINVQSLM